MRTADLLDLEQIKAAAYKARWNTELIEGAGKQVTLRQPGFAGSILLEVRGPRVQPLFEAPEYAEELFVKGWLDDDCCLISIKDEDYLRDFFNAAAELVREYPPKAIASYSIQLPEAAAARENAVKKSGSLQNLKTAALRETMMRIGQDFFRKKLDERWRFRCAVTGAATREALRASHIKPWAESTAKERLDEFNGLLLTANLDALFDKGLITFSAAGTIQISPLLSVNECKILGVNRDMRLREHPTQQESYMSYHRQKLFRRD